MVRLHGNMSRVWTGTHPDAILILFIKLTKFALRICKKNHHKLVGHLILYFKAEMHQI